VGEDRFDLWFAAAEIRLDGQRMVIAVETAFSLERIRKSFYRDVTDVALETMGADAKIDLVLASPKPTIAGETAGESESIRIPAGPRNGGEQVLPKSPAMMATSGRRFASLDTFIMGECNRLAYRSTELVLEQLGKISPFFVYGPAGIGKTHLLEGIWTAVRRSQERRRVVYLSAEQFTTYFVQALKGGGLPSFRRKYRDVDLLLIDDIQFFAGKQATLVELLYTLDSVLRDRGQVVLSADKPPLELRQMGQELTTRLSSGLVCELRSLDVETRIGILNQQATVRQLPIPPDTLRELAELAPGDGRQLIGAINRLWVQSRANGKPVTIELVREVAGELFPNSRSLVRLADIERVVCKEFGLDAELLKSDKRSRNVSHPRMLAMWLARKYTRAGLGEISEYFGRKSHSTVVSAQTAVEQWVASGQKVQCLQAARDVRDLVRSLEQNLKTG
jgi:chromosomal replication initiator protein